ncbi:MAG: hypothetical protein ACHQD7_12410, partial [Chitinophagales bacterium]
MKSAVILLSFLFVHLFTAAQPFASCESGEFSFALNDKNYDGSSGWQLVSMDPGKDDQHGDGVIVKLDGTGNLKGIGIAITYLLSPDLPVIRKQIRISNRTAKEIRLESFDGWSRINTDTKEGGIIGVFK